MRRENRMRNRGLNIKKTVYISGSILAVAIIGFVITFFIYGNNLENKTNLAKKNNMIIDQYENKITEETSLNFGKRVNEIENQEANVNYENQTNTEKYAINTSAMAEENDTVEENDRIIENIETKKEEKEEEETKDPTFKKPVSGEIITKFAKDNLVYSNTLGEWITHNGIDIKAEKTSVIKSAAEGIIKSIKNDPRYGLTVVIEHDNNFTTVYSNLLTAEFVVEGEHVKQEQTIGTVGNTATFEIADEPHLHFELKKDDESLDPELYIKD